MKHQLRIYFTFLLLICFSSTSLLGYTQTSNFVLNGATSIGLNKSSSTNHHNELKIAFSTIDELILENETEDNSEESLSDGDIHTNYDVYNCIFLKGIDTQCDIGIKPISLTILYCVFRI